MLINILLLVIGLVLLVRGADAFVDGSVAIARRWHIPEIVIGLTIVAMGTSAPEAAVSITSAFYGANGVAIGNVLGSNIANIFLILGVTAVISVLSVGKNTVRYEIPFVGFITLVLMWMGARYGMVSHWGAAILCALFVAFLAYLFRISGDGAGDVPLLIVKCSRQDVTSQPGADALGIPFRDGPLRHTERILLSIREGKGGGINLYLQLAFRVNTINGLIVNHAAIVGEECAVLPSDIDERSREAVRTRAIVAALFETSPVGRFRTSGITVATATTISGIDRTETATMTILVGTLHVVIQTVAFVEPQIIGTRQPSCSLVISHRRIVESGGRSCRQGIAGRYLDVNHIELVIVITAGKHEKACDK